MGLLGPSAHVNKRGEKYYLHKTEGRGGTILFFFSKDLTDTIDIPNGWEVIESEHTGMPLLKKKTSGQN